MSYELCNRPHSLWSLCGSVVERWSRESEGLRFDSSWHLRIFSLSHARDKMKKTSFSIIKIVQQTEWRTTNDLGKQEHFFVPANQLLEEGVDRE